MYPERFSGIFSLRYQGTELLCILEVSAVNWYPSFKVASTDNSRLLLP